MRQTTQLQLWPQDQFEIRGDMLKGESAWLHIERVAYDYNVGFSSSNLEILFKGATQAELDAIIAAMRRPFERQRAELQATAQAAE